MFTNDESYEISIRAWVCMKNATTGCKWRLSCIFLNLFLSVLKPCSQWNSDTLDAIVESAMLNDSTEYWISSSELPRNINRHGAN